MLRKKLIDIGVHTPMTVIPNGIDVTVLRPGDKTEASKRLGLDADSRRLLFVGNFVPVKGIEYLLQAFPAVRDEFPDCELVLLGADPGKGDKTRYSSLIDSAGIRDCIRIVDRLPHDLLPLWMHASDVLVLPSLNEGFGLVAAEALGCGRPVVSTRSGGPEDIVMQGTGKLVEPADAEALAQALISVLYGEGIGDAESLSHYARTKFSYETVTGMILDVYRNVLGV